MISMCCFSSSIGRPELARDLRNLVVLQQAQVLGDDLLGRRALEAEVPELQPEALLQVARRDADRVEALHERSARSTSGDRPVAHRRDLVDRRHQVPVVVEVADDGRADLAHDVVVGLDRELPQQVVGERGRRRERVLDRRKFLDFLRRARPVAVVEVVAEEVLVVLVVPGVGLLLLGRLFRLLRHRRAVGRLQLLGGHLLEHRVLDHLLVQQVAELERRHRQQLDGLLQRRRQDQLLNELGVEFLLNRHGLTVHRRIRDPS